LLSAEKFEPVTWADGFDLKTGKVNENIREAHTFRKIR
jgi:hypothetical protein